MVLIAFSGTLFFNVAVKPDNFMSALSEETPDVIITPQEQNINELACVLKEDLLVENTLKYSVDSVKIDDTVVTVFACD